MIDCQSMPLPERVYHFGDLCFTGFSEDVQQAFLLVARLFTTLTWSQHLDSSIYPPGPVPSGMSTSILQSAVEVGVGICIVYTPYIVTNDHDIFLLLSSILFGL